MNMITDEEADDLDEYYTRNPPAVDPSKNRMANKPFRMILVDDFTADCLATKARIANTTPAEVLKRLVRQELKVAAV
ncbi:MAG: hypothetical protein LBS82_01800 [Spirochaetaceae bacterium]|jgi:hypothetical protein|nr:hypothetical protein [Spirochaetaceae bacterium]